MGSEQSRLVRLTTAITRRLGRQDQELAQQVHERPQKVFVLGNQKSGSTAIAALLAECIGEAYFSDVLHTHKLQLKDLLEGRTSIAELRRDHPESFEAMVVKDNDFTFLYPSLARAFPEASVVFVARDPRQNIRSILNRLKIPGDLESLPEEQYARLRAKLPGWHPILTGSSFGGDGGHYIDVLADRWVRANEVYARHGDQLTLVRYEDFDAAKRQVIEETATRLGFSVAHDITASQDRQFQPLGDRSITPEEFFGEANLARLEARCEPLMDLFGYAPTPTPSRSLEPSPSPTLVPEPREQPSGPPAPVVVAVSPHQDDEILSMGAAILDAVSAGSTVIVLLVSRGERSSVRTRQLPRHLGFVPSPHHFSALRDREFDCAVRVMGATPVIPPYEERLADGAATPELVARMIRAHVPLGAAALTTSVHDGHPDHQACAEAVRDLVAEGHLSRADYFMPPDRLDLLPEGVVVEQVGGATPVTREHQAPYRRRDLADNWWGIGQRSVKESFDHQLLDPVAYRHD